MEELREELIDAYAYEMSVAASSFELMGRLLDTGYVKSRIDLFGLSELFIYGGGYLGIQFYRAVSAFVKIPAIIDKKGKAQVDVPDIPVTDIRSFQKTYKGQKVIIASVRFYREIIGELRSFVSESQVISLGEFLGGMPK